MIGAVNLREHARDSRNGAAQYALPCTCEVRTVGGMRASRRISKSSAGAAALMIASALFVSASSSVADADPVASLPACIGVGTEARYVPYGYNHIVRLTNGCSKAATCSVSTDVNPQATSVDVAASSAVDVLTFTASPAQTFHARVTCKLH